MLSENVREKIGARVSFGAWEDYAENYEQYVASREERVPAFVAEELGDRQQMHYGSLALRQAHVHRATALFEGALHAAASDNFYSMVLSIRGHFETTASIGYLHSRLNSLKRGTIEAQRFHQDVATQMLGGRDKKIVMAPQAKQILDMLEHADKSVSIHVLDGSAKEHDALTDCYLWLSEFCHPNYHSNSVSVDIDKTVPEFRFRHGKPMRDRECKILEYLLISGQIFIALFEQTGDLITEVFG